MTTSRRALRILVLAAAAAALSACHFHRCGHGRSPGFCVPAVRICR